MLNTEDKQFGNTFIFSNNHKWQIEDLYQRAQVCSDEEKRNFLLQRFGNNKGHMLHLGLDDLEKRFAHFFLDWPT